MNPYRAPLVDSLGDAETIQPSDLFDGPLEFDGELTKQHHRDAVTKAGIRTEYRRSLNVLLALAGPFTLCLLVLVLISGDLSPATLSRLTKAAVLFIGGATFFCMHHRWLIKRQVPGFQLAEGHLSGWIGREGLYLETPQFKTYCPLDMLVSSAATHDLWVFSFGREHTFWQTIPIDAFHDPSRARRIAAELQRLRPPVQAQLTDERRRLKPDVAPYFQQLDGAVAFEGNFFQDAANGTRLMKASKRIARRNWIAFCMFLLGIIGSVLALVGFQTTYFAFAAVWIGILLARVYFRTWRARRRAKQDGRTVMWYSKGWLDDEGYCAITTLGQSKSAWGLFDRYEITDDAIGLYPHESDACCCLIGRSQFANQSDWETAVDLVRRSNQ